MNSAPLPRIREQPEDFRVDEEAAYEASGEGTHTFVHIEKRMRTTEEVARALARAADVASRDIGYAGRKDRVAITRQWFSVPDWAPAEAAAFDFAGVEVLAALPHPHKLRTGHLRGNRFDIVVRDVAPETAELLGERVQQLRERGMPNRYGAQRFGRDGDNALRGAAYLRGDLKKVDRRERRFLCSALQSAVFNQVLEERPLALDLLEVGDIAVRHVSGGLFEVEDAEREAVRAASFEISATGPIFGSKMEQTSGAPAERERRVLDEFGIPAPEDFRAPRGLRMRGGRRALRICPADLEAEPIAGEKGAWRLRFGLPAGSYATVLIEELVGAFAEGARAAVS